MDQLIIEGGEPLQGTIPISGSKNAALPLLISTILLTKKTATFYNVPQLRDIKTTISLLKILGGKVETEEHAVYITPNFLNYEAPYDLVCTMRASILVLGPLIARIGKAKVAMPGGCAIGSRPINLHLKALEKMGASFTLDNGYLIGTCRRLKGSHIYFDFPTVGGTEHIMLTATLAEGETIIENAAQEPEIIDLANFLNNCGACIKGHGSNIINIKGVSELTGCNYTVMPDRIEAGTFLTASAITGGNLTLLNCPHQGLETTIDKLTQMGLIIEKNENTVQAIYTSKLNAVNIITQPFPGFPTDMQAQIMALMCLAENTSIVKETIFENRFMHVQELIRMGANIQLNGNVATIKGVEKLIGAPVMASDLRASASLVLAGLAAKGTTTIQRTYHLDRGYEYIEKKLKNVGARIKRIPT